MLEVTSVRVELADRQGDVLAYASIVISRALVVRGIRIVRGPSGFIVAMPSRLGLDGDWRDHVYAIDPKTRDCINLKVLQAYNRHEAQGRTKASHEK